MINMRDIITEKYKHLLYKDECGDDFLLTNDCEIYVQSPDKIRLICFRNGANIKRRFKGLILDFFITDDGLYHFDVDRRNLPKILANLPILQKRLKRGSKKIANLEEILAHKILNYRPKLKEKK